jgi:hypothetical protein
MFNIAYAFTDAGLRFDFTPPHNPRGCVVHPMQRFIPAFFVSGERSLVVMPGRTPGRSRIIRVAAMTSARYGAAIVDGLKGGWRKPRIISAAACARPA